MMQPSQQRMSSSRASVSPCSKSVIASTRFWRPSALMIVV